VKRTRQAWTWPFALLLLTAAVAVGVSACGGGDDDESSAGSSADRAFLEAMIPHHQSAIAMARIAKSRAEHPQVTELANAIVTAQAKEIRQIKRIHRRLFDEPILPNEDAHEALGLTAEEAGMGHMDATADLKQARPFDKAFIDEMIGHHQGAIRMAQAVTDETADDEIQSLAQTIVGAQSREIEAMNRWREAWYGEPSPAGGVPASKLAPAGDESMGEHDGH
jgi:uncharacterized protein (DUF305 family)